MVYMYIFSVVTLDGNGFDLLVRQYSFMEVGHEIISTASFSLPQIQVGHLSVTGEGLKPAQKKCG